MNIFVTNESPYLAAAGLDNRRLVKMQVETMQLFAYAFRHLSIGREFYPLTSEGNPYKDTGSHLNHPCTLWMIQSRENMEWLVDHLEGLMAEYEFRFERPCNSRPNLERIKKSVKFWSMKKEFEGFVNCSMFKDEPDVIKAYRMTIVAKIEKATEAANPRTAINYGARGYPDWYQDIKENTDWKTR